MLWILAGAVLLLGSFVLKGPMARRAAAVIGGGLVIVGLIRL